MISIDSTLNNQLLTINCFNEERHMSERVFYPDTNDVSSASKVVALSIAVFRFNALTIQRFNEALAAKALATAARGKSHSMIVVC